jgi:hypothetical protein
MPITVPYKMEKVGANTTIFMFDKLFDYSDYITQAESVITTGKAKRMLNDMNSAGYIDRQIRQYGGGNDWYGTTDRSLINNNYTTYLFNNELSLFIEGLRDRTVRSSIVDIDQKKKVTFTEKEIGIFSFDLASIGLIKVVEYYSPYINEIVDANYVRSRKRADGEREFYFIGMRAFARHILKPVPEGLWSLQMNKVIPVEKAQKEQDGDIVNYYYEQEAIPEHVVEQRQVIGENGKKKYTTTWKKSFIYIPKVKNKIPRIDIIINASFSWKIKGDTQMIWSCMAAIALAEKLQAAGINFRIFGAYCERFDNRKKVFTFVKLKDAAEPININATAIAVSDPRQYRFLGFKGILTTAWQAGYDADITNSIGTPLNDADEIKTAFLDLLKKQQDFDQQNGTMIESSKIVFTQALSQAEAIAQFNDTVKAISNVTYTP